MGNEVNENVTSLTSYVPGNEGDAKTDDRCQTVPLQDNVVFCDEIDRKIVMNLDLDSKTIEKNETHP